MTSLRQLLPAALLAATAALGLSTVGSIATASAAPTEWDIERYDDCMKGGPSDDPSETIAWTRKCCLDSGGVWNDSMGKCQSPPMNPAQASTRPALHAGSVLHTLEPAAPPPTRIPSHVITPSLAVAP